MADSAMGPTNKRRTENYKKFGNTPYHQAKIGKGFIAVPPRQGHTQKQNVKPK